MSIELILETFSKMPKQVEKAWQHTQQGELIKAETIYHEILEKQTNYPPALYGLAVLADKINDQLVREELLCEAIDQIKDSNDRNKKSLIASWLTELADSLIKQNRQNEARECINESERLINENLTGR